ncbi:hypothetical protein F9278_44980 [Streptomyces phaeolivaceus]|uniref:Uncharacterized protein n=1 Tax=Streptomyces phaeolivaceus TaxID=2653200 RepID=A0A5P8KHN6_9ACTN|nr:hypothetical protein [Streptomyces phaeolivaceus]QFR02128.1 hypothetical protein F9278_44980 [Streptomyces phaeolivaceus]
MEATPLEPAEPRGTTHHQAVDLGAGREFILFFADSPAGLPGDAVTRELRTAARLARAQHTRGVLDTVLEQLGAGIVGGVGFAGVSASLRASLRATTRYFGLRRPSPEPATLPQVVARLRETCEIVLGTAPASLDDADLRRQEDGTWKARFVHVTGTYEAHIDRDGTIVHWVHTRHPDSPA